MRILLLTWACDLEDVSEPQIAARWVRELARDHEVTLLAVSRPDRFGCVRAQFPDVEVIEWRDIRVPQKLERLRAILKPGYLPYYFKARRFLKRLLRERTFDLIHHISPFAWRYPSPAAGLGVPFVRGPVAGGLETPVGLRADQRAATGASWMRLRATDRWRRRWDPSLRATFETADHVFAAAPYVNELLSDYRLRGSSVEIEHGLSDDSYTMNNDDGRRSQNDVFKLLFVGRLIPTKGLHYAIRALANCANRESIVLTVLGDGEDRARNEQEARRLGVAGQVRFEGWCDSASVQQHYAAADALIFPSFREPTGGVLLEAMAAGLPVITCDYGGPQSMVDDHCGYRVAPTSPKAFVAGLSQAVDELFEHPERRLCLGASARERALAAFGWAAKRERIRQVYEDVTRPVSSALEAKQ